MTRPTVSRFVQSFGRAQGHDQHTHVSTSSENLAKIDRVDLEITGLTEIVQNKYITTKQQPCSLVKVGGHTRKDDVEMVGATSSGGPFSLFDRLRRLIHRAK